MIYTGIGSRKTPNNYLNVMDEISIFLSKQNYTLRSGGADGADSAFEKNAILKEIYLPWKGFNGKLGYYDISKEAETLAKRIHPLKNKLSGPTLKLHARNCYQILGRDLKTPTNFVVCWTPNGEDIGGTATAIKLAKLNNIKVFNLANLKPSFLDWKNEYENWIGSKLTFS